MASWQRITACVLVLVASLPAMAREQVRIVGSSTVFPFVAAAAEQFSHQGKFRTPIVEVNGTGGGFKLFCEGVGDGYPDIANASRPIKPSEADLCAAHGVKNIAEITLGYDGIVIANALNSPAITLSRKAVFLALAREVPKDGKLVPNFYTRWNEIDSALPDAPIEVYGPPPAEGTRDAFVELVMDEACKDFPEYAKTYTDAKLRGQKCGAVREDGRYVELLGGNLMVQKLINNPQALAVFSYSFLDQNKAVVKANAIEGVMPELGTIADHRYSVSRSLFLYVKREHLASVPGLKEFVQFIVSGAASGEDGFLVLKGLIPLPKAEHQAMQKQAAGL